MKKAKPATPRDTLRPEYRRDDFGQMVRGKYAAEDAESAGDPGVDCAGKEELDRRLAEFEADPESGATLEEVLARVRRRP